MPSLIRPGIEPEFYLLAEGALSTRPLTGKLRQAVEAFLGNQEKIKNIF